MTSIRTRFRKANGFIRVERLVGGVVVCFARCLAASKPWIVDGILTEAGWRRGGHARAVLASIRKRTNCAPIVVAWTDAAHPFWLKMESEGLAVLEDRSVNEEE